jgi:hypothetical protein
MNLTSSDFPSQPRHGHDTKMNNSQFRKLVLDTPARQGSSSSPSDKSAQSRNGATPFALGSRMRSSIPMTPYVFLSLSIPTFEL